MIKRPTKAIIAAAGFGTRFLPQTKAMPKEMLPLIDKPIIQYVVEELVAAGIRDIIIVGSSNKRAIEDHFDVPNEDLLANLRAGGEKKKRLLEETEAIGDMANFIYLRQKGPYGNATPLLCAAHLIGEDEPFIYTFADDFFVASPNRTEQMIQTYVQYGGPVLACKKVQSDAEYDRYGIVAGMTLQDDVIQVDRIIEKPGKARAPSDLASVSGYLLTAEIVDYINDVADCTDEGELMLQPAVQTMIDEGKKVYAKNIQGGKFYDTGDKLEYLKTVLDFGMAHPSLGKELRDYFSSTYR